MDHSQSIWTQESSNDSSDQVPFQSSMLYSDSTATEFFAHSLPVTTGFFPGDTSFTNQHTSGPVFNPLEPSFGNSAVLPHSYRPDFSTPQSPMQYSFPDPSLLMDMSSQTMQPPVCTQQSLRDHGQHRQRPHPYLIDQRPAHARQPLVFTNKSAIHHTFQSFVPPVGGSINSRQPVVQRPPSSLQQQAQQHRRRDGFFDGASNFIINNSVLGDNSNSDDFLVMSRLLKETIPGAEFDSSARDPPPRCHPGTRLSILERARRFISNRDSNKKMRWIVGPAGVGKSAIMQDLAETMPPHVILGASIFFSINGRSDGKKAITTLVYQLAVRDVAYRRFVQDEITNDPSLLQKSLTVQFSKFIFHPFVYRFSGAHRRLIVIDGLDECEDHHIQCELLGLISYFCITYPTSPLIWVVASRPEPHITSLFSRAKVIPAYEKEEIQVDSDEACEDVERFLRNEFKKIKRKSPTLRNLPQWPTEREFLKIADSSKGLFAYASTVIRFIDDPTYGNPALQLEQVLDVIGTNSKWTVEGKSHPMAHLDALYSRILSRVPADVMADTRKLLLTMIKWRWNNELSTMCNWLGFTKDVAYGAIYHLRSVIYVSDSPEVDEDEEDEVDEDEDEEDEVDEDEEDEVDEDEEDEVDEDKVDEDEEDEVDEDKVDEDEEDEVDEDKVDEDAVYLKVFHKSFVDYLEDFDRSKFCPDLDSATDELKSLCTRRILEVVPNGALKHDPATYANVSLSWPVQELEASDKMRFEIYTIAVRDTIQGFVDDMPAFQNSFFIHAITTFDESVMGGWGKSLFDEDCRPKLMEHNILRQIPAGALISYNVLEPGYLEYRFQCPAAAMATIPDPWDPSCTARDRSGQHKEGLDQKLEARFDPDNPNIKCNCKSRFFHNIEHGKTRYPNKLVTAFIPVTLGGLVEYHFVDPENVVNRWRYTFSYKFSSRTGM